METQSVQLETVVRSWVQLALALTFQRETVGESFPCEFQPLSRNEIEQALGGGWIFVLQRYFNDSTQYGQRMWDMHDVRSGTASDYTWPTEMKVVMAIEIVILPLCFLEQEAVF